MQSLLKNQLIAACIYLVASGANWAQAETTKLSLSDLENMMLGQSPALRGAADAVNAARAAVDTARTIPNPQLEVLNGTRYSRPQLPNASGALKSVSLTQDLDMPWHRFPRVDGALAGLNAAQATE